MITSKGFLKKYVKIWLMCHNNQAHLLFLLGYFLFYLKYFLCGDLSFLRILFSNVTIFSFASFLHVVEVLCVKKLLQILKHCKTNWTNQRKAFMLYLLAPKSSKIDPLLKLKDGQKSCWILTLWTGDKMPPPGRDLSHPILIFIQFILSADFKMSSWVIFVFSRPLLNGFWMGKSISIPKWNFYQSYNRKDEETLQLISIKTK